MKLHFPYDPKCGEHFGTSRWRQWTHIIISTLVCDVYICFWCICKGLVTITKWPNRENHFILMRQSKVGEQTPLLHTVMPRPRFISSCYAIIPRTTVVDADSWSCSYHILRPAGKYGGICLQCINASIGKHMVTWLKWGWEMWSLAG